MSLNMKINQQNFSTIQQLSEQYLNPKTAKKESNREGTLSFEEILKSKQEGTEPKTAELKFSKHADSRLAERNISLSENQMQRLYDGTEKAKAKGIKESLVMVDDYAFIVNIKNNIVVTAMNREESNDTVITNIDGAVII